MIRKGTFFLFITLVCTFAQGAWAWTGSGTADSPYILTSAADWESFTFNVNDGSDADKYFKLANDWDNSAAPVTAIWGTEAHPFTGNFDGNGRTLYVNISDTETQGTAPFRNVKGATLRKLTVAGEVTGTSHAAGLVGFVRAGGTTTISDCIVKATINNSTGSGKGYIGGLVGHGTTATLVIQDCVFRGILNNTSDYAGGLQGWSDGNTLTISNSFFTGLHLGDALFHPIALQYYDKTTQYTNLGAYYVSSEQPTVADERYIAATGKPVYREPVSGENSNKIIAPDGQEFYLETLLYNECSWDAVNKKVVSTMTVCPTYQVIEGVHPDDWLGLTDGYYVVKNEAMYKVLNIMGSDVHLILADNATLECNHVKLEGSNKLHIHGSSEGTGILNVENHKRYTYASRHGLYGTRRHYKTNGIFTKAAGIGGGSDTNMGSLYVHGGIVNVNQGGLGAAIGGGENAGIGGEVVVYDGTVTAKCVGYDGNGAAIGGGEDYSQGGPVTIYGGTVKAISIRKGAGIGGEDGGHGGLVTIWGGNVYAKAGNKAAAIGGGYKGNGGTVYIHGGKVLAEAGSSFDSQTGCGIGGGYDGAGGDVHILGGTVEAFGGDHCSAIGAQGDEPLGTIEFADNMKVTAGDASFSDDETVAIPERVFTAGEREPACQWRKWAKIEPCDHTQPTDQEEPFYYTLLDNTNHTRHCRYCNTTWEENHLSDHCICGQESRVVFNLYAPDVTRTNTYAISSQNRAGVGTKFPLPACDIVPDGYTFAGWEMNPETVGKWAYVKGDPLIKPQEDVEVLAGMDDANFYARYLYKFTTEWTWDSANPATGASVTIRHPHLSDLTYTATDTEMNITSGDLTKLVTLVDEDGTLSEEDVKIGTCYTATCTFTVDGNEYTVVDSYEAVDVNDIIDISIIDNADNAEKLMENDECKANVTLSGRTLYKDGSWNTLCLPFDVDNLKGTPLEGATVKTLASSDYDSATGTLTLDFSDSRHALSAGIPYIVKWTTTGPNITNPVFQGVVIDAIASTVGSPFVDFEGAFSPVVLEQDNHSVLFLGENNKLYYPNAEMQVNACRAVFRLHNGITVGGTMTNDSEAKAFVLNFGDDEESESTGIIEVASPNPSAAGKWSASAWYSLDGRKLSGMPAAKGIYIHNGRKVAIQ